MGVESFLIGINIFVFLLLPEFISCYPYPMYGGKKYGRASPPRRYLTMPISRQNEFQVPDYDDGYVPMSQDDYEYNSYEKDPYMQQLSYLTNKNNYYQDKSSRKNMGYRYYEEPVPQDPLDDFPEEMEKEEIYPYGQENWYEEDPPRYDNNADANAAFLQNLMLAQMYQNPRNKYPLAYNTPSKYPLGYGPAVDNYDNRHWYYGVPTTSIREKEKVQKYFKKIQDEEVRQLEALTRKANKNKNIKNEDDSNIKMLERLEKPVKPTKQGPKMSDEEYFHLQKQMILNSRKNKQMSNPEVMNIKKKQVYNPEDIERNFWEFRNPKFRSSNYPETATSSIKKLNLGRGAKSAALDDSKNKVETTTATLTSTVSPKKLKSAGQKEFVLPRPSNSVRGSYNISIRNLQQGSAYDTINKLLAIERDLQQDEISQPQKRFVLNEDQLTSELNGLKKSP